MTNRRVLLVAHRGANLAVGSSDLSGAGDPTGHEVAQWWSAHGADLIEADVHLFRGRLEVRHSKALWPTSRLFEDRMLLDPSSPRPSLQSVLQALPDRPHLWLDLKGPDPRLPRLVDDTIGDRRPLWVSARCWWQLAPFRNRPDVTTFMSVGSAWQRPLAVRLLARQWTDGIVIHERLATTGFMQATASTAPVVIWAVGQLGRAASLIELGAGGLIIDDPEFLLRTRRHIDAGRR